MRVAVISAVFAELDYPKQVCAQSVPCEWVFVSDTPTVPPDGWRHIIEPSDLPPRLAAKRPKLYPWLYTSADVYIWIDGSFQVTSHRFVEDAVAALGDAPLAQWKHPDRVCLFDEAVVSLGMEKYRWGRIPEQVDWYRAEGMPERWGLWATGCIVRRHTPEVAAHSDLWDLELRKWSVQDQVSEPFVLWRCGLRPVELPGELWPANPWMAWHSHQKDI